MIVDKVWGHEQVLCNEPEYCCKRLHISEGRRSSLHYHRVKKETFIVEQGTVLLETPGQAVILKPGEQATLAPETSHRFSSITGNATILEVSTHHDDADVVRLEPSGLTP